MVLKIYIVCRLGVSVKVPTNEADPYAFVYASFIKKLLAVTSFLFFFNWLYLGQLFSGCLILYAWIYYY